MIHFSVDDTIEIFRYLTENNGESIFECPNLNKFRTLHREFGFKVSMYCFYETEGFDLSMCTDKYRQEFKENADWLRFGFHARNEASKYNDCPPETFREDLLKTVSELRRIVSEEAITYDVRLGFGQGNRGCIRAMKDSFDHFKVLYGVDDGRIVYYLNEEENSRYLAEGMFYDEEMGITIRHCERRLESSKAFVERIKQIDADRIYPFFSHEISLQKDQVWDYLRMLCEKGEEFIL